MSHTPPTPTPTFAIDLETVETVPIVDFKEPSHFEPFAISVAARSHADDAPTARVFTRANGSERELRKLIAKAIDWILATTPTTLGADAPTLLTFNGRLDPPKDPELADRVDGHGFDLPILDHHASATMRNEPVSASLSAALNRVFDQCERRDLFVELVADQPRGAKFPSFDEACHDHSITLETPRCDGRTIGGSDMPELGRAVMDGSITEPERAALVKYSRQDATALLELERKMSEPATPKPEVADA